MPTLDIGGRVIQYDVLRGTGRRYTYFHFRPDLTLEVVVPRGRPVDVLTAVKEKSSWLSREYDRMKLTKYVLTDDSVMLGGRQLRLLFQEGPEDALITDLDAGTVTIRARDKIMRKELVRRWFLKESSTYAVKKTAELARVVGTHPSRVDVREIGKWGYCTRNHRLSFSWQLIALPDRLREYVVLHELTHLLEFNHSATFRKKLGAVCPDYKARERELDLVIPYNRLEPPS